MPRSTENGSGGIERSTRRSAGHSGRRGTPSSEPVLLRNLGANRETSHWPDSGAVRGCWAHHAECAIARVDELTRERDVLRAALERVSQAPYTTNGDTETILDRCLAIASEALAGRGEG